MAEKVEAILTQGLRSVATLGWYDFTGLGYGRQSLLSLAV